MSRKVGTYSDYWASGGQGSQESKPAGVRIEDNGGPTVNVIHYNTDGSETVVPTSRADYESGNTTTWWDPITGIAKEVQDALNRGVHGEPCTRYSREAGGKGYSKRERE